jgi:peroxiredoxin
MAQGIQINTLAPDFALTDTKGQAICLSDFRGQKNVLLVFNRGFTWPFCLKHMAQLRQDFQKFSDQDTVILVVGPEDQSAFQRYWQQHDLPFVGLPNPNHSVLKQFGQQVKLFKLGRMPAQVIIDKQGITRYAHFGDAMSDIPDNTDLLAFIAKLNGEGVTISVQG